ncbi:hypothetical protein [Nitrincola alkalilacustris]|uniref:hypothetical protein n=1 Tax=Nitrincola alkalilacustris TaxID=1571224 RepID=UPI00124C550D|nr:hypothetical protein [Nitrincola alkalilacustris]
MSMLLHPHKPTGLPSSLRNLGAPCYLHQTHWLVWRLMLCSGLAVMLAGLSFSIWRIFSGLADTAEWILMAFIMPFLIILLRPKTWRTPIAMAADPSGLFFVGGDDYQESLFVPWNEIGQITIERHSAGSGMIKTVVLEIAANSPYWDDAKASTVIKHLLQPELPSGFRRLPLGNQGINPKKTKDALEALRARSRYR